MKLRFNPVYLWWKDLHKPTVYALIVLICISVFAVFSASYQAGMVNDVANLRFFKRHLLYVFLAICSFVFFATRKEEYTLKLAIMGFSVCLLLLFLTLTSSAHGVKGAERWIDFKVVTVQPSELLKPFFIVLSAYIYYFFEKTKNYAYLLIYAVVVVFICGILFFQPDFGMMMTYLFIAGMLLFFASINWKGLLAFVLVIVAFVLISFLTLPHVKLRILKFISGQGMYQTEIARQAVENGGIFGKGVGAGEFSRKLPDSHNDFIFSRIGEEFGGLALVGIVLVFLVLIMSNLLFVLHDLKFLNTKMQTDEEGYVKYRRAMMIENAIILLSISLISFEFFFNIAVNVGLMPPKGMVLPFVSYGGSALVGHGILAGVLCGANRRRYHFFTQNYSIY